MNAAPLLFALIKRQSILIQYTRFCYCLWVSTVQPAQLWTDSMPGILMIVPPSSCPRQFRMAFIILPCTSFPTWIWKCQVVLTECIINCLLIEAGFAVSKIGDKYLLFGVSWSRVSSIKLMVEKSRGINCTTRTGNYKKSV